MDTLKLDDIQLVLANPQAQVRTSLRMALNDAGIRNSNIVDGGELSVIREALQSSFGADILICDTGSNSEEMLKMLQGIRNNEIGPNPFLGIIAISWEPTWETVDRVMGTGVDFVLAAPVSPQQILDRISSLIHHRKPFVITSDYVGPDRRDGVDRAQSGPLIEVPNTLRAKALGEWNPDEMRRELDEALGVLNEYKMDRHAFRLAHIAELIASEFDRDPNKADRSRLRELLMTALDLRKRASQAGLVHVAELCSAVQTIAENLRDPASQSRAKNVELLQQLAFAIRAAVKPAEGEENLAIDIAHTVNSSRGS